MTELTQLTEWTERKIWAVVGLALLAAAGIAQGQIVDGHFEKAREVVEVGQAIWPELWKGGREGSCS